MKKTFFIIVTAIILTGCSQNASTLEKVSSQKNEPSLEKVSFEKKKECAELRDQIEARIQKDWPESEFNGYIALEKIFYSPKQDSCLYTYKVSRYVKDLGTSFEDYELVDAFTNESITGETGCIPVKDCDGIQSVSEAHYKFSAELKQYE